MEKVLADAKYDMRNTRLRSLDKIKMEGCTCFCMDYNLKKVTSYLWKSNGVYRFCAIFKILVEKIAMNNTIKLVKSIFLIKRK
ncbi:hypothetical protein BCD95_005426 [Clostridium beijerinckii]|uniref:Uncharacterized protein n=1 Tax=Clostridium beijerinckii TaxID=1520 RepID=A0AAE5HAU6_CLOBE|nr:hypothetical protein X276_15220 [Clostridium beijerinckii NRRL B-598]NSB17167.1 hypothetical protein [Clostridium beijerinckii]OOM23192.1 hypothetical protein CLOBE_41780 [Clostridium beijerinckii]